jgi:hypothetical protein
MRKPRRRFGKASARSARKLMREVGGSPDRELAAEYERITAPCRRGTRQPRRRGTRFRDCPREGHSPADCPAGGLDCPRAGHSRPVALDRRSRRPTSSRHAEPRSLIPRGVFQPMALPTSEMTVAKYPTATTPTPQTREPSKRNAVHGQAETRTALPISNQAEVTTGRSGPQKPA